VIDVPRIWLAKTRSPANVLLDLLVGLINICPLLRHREKVLNRVKPLGRSLVLRASWWQRPLINAEMASSLLILGMDIRISEKWRM
jgi:hypothetical protein